MPAKFGLLIPCVANQRGRPSIFNFFYAAVTKQLVTCTQARQAPFRTELYKKFVKFFVSMPSAILVCNVEIMARHFGGNLLVGRGTLQTTLIALRHNSYCCSMQTANPNRLGPAPCHNVVVTSDGCGSLWVLSQIKLQCITYWPPLITFEIRQNLSKQSGLHNL